MQILMWMAVGIGVVLGFIVLVPVLVVGTWFVIMTVILGLTDGILWLLDQGWKKNRSGGNDEKRTLLVDGLPRGKVEVASSGGHAPSCPGGLSP